MIICTRKMRRDKYLESTSAGIIMHSLITHIEKENKGISAPSIRSFNSCYAWQYQAENDQDGIALPSTSVSQETIGGLHLQLSWTRPPANCCYDYSALLIVSAERNTHQVRFCLQPSRCHYYIPLSVQFM